MVMDTPVTLQMLAEILTANNEQLLAETNKNFAVIREDIRHLADAQNASDNRADTEFATITKRFNEVDKALKSLKESVAGT